MGETLTRTFTMDTSASRLQSKLAFDVDGIETGIPTDVTMSICQYKQKVRGISYFWRNEL